MIARDSFVPNCLSKVEPDLRAGFAREASDANSGQPARRSDSTSLAPAPRLDYLDATRAFALVLGVVFHASLSFSPYFMGWAVQDVSTSPWVPDFMAVSHAFRMETFFLLAGFFSHGLLARNGLPAFLRSRLIRLGVPFIAGWFLLRPLIMSGWIMGAASMRGDYDFWAGIRDGFATLEKLPADLFTGSHLWFLYYLLLITGLMLALKLAAQGVDRRVARGQISSRVLPRLDAGVVWLARSAWTLPVLVLPTAGALWGMQYWGLDTPDRSLAPHWPVLAIYGGGFALGWMFARQPDTIAAFGRLTVWRALLAIASAVAVVKLGGVQTDPGHPHFVAAHVAYVLGYAILMWTLVPLTLGFFRRFCSKPRPAFRYLADSSYWMYLIHLPVVVWLQVAVAEVPLPWWVKLAFVSAATIGVALLTYDLFVRATIFGQILNGRRRPRALFRLKGEG
jgi:peptidoglycan/LPS O-acetylase OafA/YrhL